MQGMLVSRNHYGGEDSEAGETDHQDKPLDGPTFLNGIKVLDTVPALVLPGEFSALDPEVYAHQEYNVRNESKET